jgi:hypothetical protein
LEHEYKRDCLGKSEVRGRGKKRVLGGWRGSMYNLSLSLSVYIWIYHGES